MPIVPFPLRLRHREINGIISSRLLFNLKQLEQLYSEDNDKNAKELSNILIWIAEKYPEILDEVAKDLFYVGDTVSLNFQDSWENPDELVPSDALTMIMNSVFCDNLVRLRGYVEPKILRNLNRSLNNLSLAIGKHTDVGKLLQEIKYHQERCCDMNYESKEKIWIHLRCCEIDLESIPILPVIHNLTLIISNVSDQDVAWVVEANARFRFKNKFISINNVSNIFANMENLFLPRSKLTKAGVEAISKGLVDKGLGVAWLAVSSPNIEDDVNWRRMIQVKYDFGFVSSCNDKDMFLVAPREVSLENTLSY